MWLSICHYVRTRMQLFSLGINMKVVQNVIMMSDHFSQKSCSECLHENFYIQCFSSSNDLLTFHRLITFMNMFCSASSVTKLLLTSHIRQLYFKEKNLIHAETGIINTDILLLVPHFYKQKTLIGNSYLETTNL